MLVGTSTIFSMLIGILFGIYAGWRRRSAFDAGATTFSMFTYSVPDFWLGMLLLVAVRGAARLVPDRRVRGGRQHEDRLAALLDQLHHMFLPALTLTLAYIGEYMIIMRSSLIDTLNEDYLQLARAKGCAIRSCAAATRCRTRCCPS